MLQIDHLVTRYGAIEALHGVSLEIAAGEIVTLIGANGAGKTSLLMTLCGTPRAAAGSIRFEGADITGWPTHRIMRAGIAIAPEGRRVFPGLSVLENLQLGAFFLDAAASRAQLAQVYDLFPRLAERAAQRAGTLSGGEQQMLAVGRALMSRPRLLLLDEPTLGLAPRVIAQIFGLIETIRATGVTIFLIEQNAHQALQVADRGYVLENGHIVLHDNGPALFDNPAVRAAYLGEGLESVGA